MQVLVGTRIIASSGRQCASARAPNRISYRLPICTQERRYLAAEAGPYTKKLAETKKDDEHGAWRTRIRIRIRILANLYLIVFAR